MSNVQPLPARAASTTNRSKDTRGPALVVLWCLLAVKAAEAAAHDHPDAESLLHQQLMAARQRVNVEATLKTVSTRTTAAGQEWAHLAMDTPSGPCRWPHLASSGPLPQRLRRRADAAHRRPGHEVRRPHRPLAAQRTQHANATVMG